MPAKAAAKSAAKSGAAKSAAAKKGAATLFKKTAATSSAAATGETPAEQVEEAAPGSPTWQERCAEESLQRKNQQNKVSMSLRYLDVKSGAVP